MDRRPAYVRIAHQVKQEFLSGPDARPGDRLPTERHFQARFGVSRATVSRAFAALAAEGLIETRQGSGAYIARADLAPVPGGRLIGFLAPYIPSPGGMQNPVLLRLYHGLEKRARERGYQLITASSNHCVAHEAALIDRFVLLGVEGVVVYPVYFPEPRRDSPDDPLARRWRDLPMVVADIGFESWGRTLVTFDNHRLGEEMTRLLLERGHRHIAFMHRPADVLHNSVHERARGWRDALRDAGRAVPESYARWPDGAVAPDLDEDAAAEARADHLLTLSPRPDAVIAHEDGAAIRLIRALLRRGVDVPGQIRVVGFDNHVAGQYFEPAFPTSRPDFSRMGEQAIDLLDRQIAEGVGHPRTYVLPAPTLWREPCAVPDEFARKGGELLVPV